MNLECKVYEGFPITSFMLHTAKLAFLNKEYKTCKMLLTTIELGLTDVEQTTKTQESQS